jgi:hypothetical protein
MPNHRGRKARLTAVALVVLTVGAVQAAPTGGFVVKTGSRETVRNFYNAVYGAANGVPVGWTGKIASCTAGTVAPANARATLTRINFFRAMAGIPAAVTFLEAFSQKAQQAALIMAANQTLSHFPSTTFKCYSKAGAEGAGNANLYIGSSGFGLAGSASVDGFMEDDGDNNASVEHRRWLLYPQTRNMGYGAVDDPGLTFAEAVAIWVIDSHFGGPRPAPRDGFVGWPPPGYVPDPLLYARWSFSYPGADFSRAVVALSADGTGLPVSGYEASRGAGENTLVWNAKLPAAAAGRDRTFHVDVRKVRVGGSDRDFSYDVIAFDPAIKGKDSVLPAVKGNAKPALLQAATYTFNKVPGAGGYQSLTAPLKAFSGVEGAENGAGRFTVDADTDRYGVVGTRVVAAGKAAFHLAHAEPRTQSLTWKQDLFVEDRAAALSFASRLGWATTAQFARVEVSADDGKTWSTLYRQAGTNGPGEAAFSTRKVSLGAYQGQVVRLRFAYVFETGSFFNQTDEGVGWHIDTIRLLKVSTVGKKTVASLGKKTQFAFTPKTSGRFVLAARATAFGGYPLEWGPGFPVAVAP